MFKVIIFQLLITILLSLSVSSKDIKEDNLYNPIWSGKTNLKKIALTFDDGPKPQNSPPLLDILDKYGVKATFFLVGREAKLYPDLVYRIFNAGHEIANHTYSHYRLDKLTDKQIKIEIQSTNKILKEITGRSIHYFRPPGGRYNRNILNILGEFNLQTILWDVNAGDYVLSSPLFYIKGEDKKAQFSKHQTSADRIYDKVMSNIKNGSIVLFHNGPPETILALPKIIQDLQKQGYSFVTVSELLQPDSSSPFIATNR